ncbi:dTMP kinase [Candidatus Pacearchaeota archaeon]|nr:dTMP kinase [Candidatus Pacearchaeota archaeon]
MVIKRGYFISFEGIDGCGKSTQIWLLGKYMFDLNKYTHMVMTREPWRNADIRAILKQDSDPYSQARKLAELFVNDRKEHVTELIAPKLERGHHVISDRFDLSTLAYQQAQGIPVQELIAMHQGILMPDLTFIVDVPVEVAIQRMKKDAKRQEEQKFEKSKEFIEKLRANYLALKDLPGRRIVIIDGTPSPIDIFENQIVPAFDKFHQEQLSK